MYNLNVFLKTNWKNILKGLLIVFVLWFMIQITTVIRIGQESKKELKQLDEHIQMVEFKQDLIQSEIQIVNEEIKLVENKIMNIKEIKIRNGYEYSKKISDTYKYGNVECDRFFTTRYKDFY